MKDSMQSGRKLTDRKNKQLTMFLLKKLRSFWADLFYPDKSLKLLKKYFKETDKESIQADWEAVAKDFEGPTIDEFLKN